MISMLGHTCMCPLAVNELARDILLYGLNILPQTFCARYFGSQSATKCGQESVVGHKFVTCHKYG
jgi:hypothetical protein